MFKKIALGLVVAGGLATSVAFVAHARQHGPDGPGGPRGGMMGRMMNQSPADRAAFLDARIAAVKAGLKLTPDQDKLWPAIEDAVRGNAKVMSDMREKMQADGKPADMMDGLTKMADAATARAEGLHKLADAARPLYATLSDEQKGRLPVLMHGMGRGEGGHHRWMR